MAVRQAVASPGVATPAPRRGTFTAIPASFDRASALLSGGRELHLLAIDLVGIVVAACLALTLRFDRLDGVTFVPAFPLVVLLLLVVRSFVHIRLGLYGGRWRFVSVPELELIVAAAALGSLGSMAIFYGLSAVVRTTWADGFPRSFWLIELLLTCAIVGGIRFGIRARWNAWPRRDRARAPDRRATLLYGAGQTGALLARFAQQDPGSGVLPVGFLDDDPTLGGRIVAGVNVLGSLDDMARAVALTGAGTLLITMPSAAGSRVRRIVDAAHALNLEVRTVPSMTDLLDGTADAHRVRPVRVEDLLRRPMARERAGGVEEIIRDRTVVITGGGGSIGSELARQVFALGPRRLVLVDRAESPLYLTQRELERLRERGRAEGELRVHLANVASRAVMDRLIAAEAPSVIFTPLPTSTCR